MLSAGSLQAQFSLGGGSVCEVLAHDVCKLGQPWPLVILKPAQRPNASEGLKWELGADSRRYHKNPRQPLRLRVRPSGLPEVGSWKLYPSAPAPGPTETEI